MAEWLAVIAFCIVDKCMFWADTQTPYASDSLCRHAVEQAQALLLQNGVRPEDMLSTCLPIRFVKSGV